MYIISKNVMKLLLFSLFFLQISFIVSANERRIAITIDDAPMPSTHLFSGIERTKRIIQGLEQENAIAGIFVLGTHLLDDTGKERITLYDQAGHIIGNHTYSHYMCKKISADKFIDGIQKTHELIKNYQNFKLLFRYPYLDECGNKTKKLQVQEALEKLKYQNAYVTIVTLDYHFNHLLQKALRHGKKINYDKLKQIYLNTTLEYIDFYSSFIDEKLGYSAPHSLLLHENDINALYLPNLIHILKTQGWQIIPPQEVYENNEIVSKVKTIIKTRPNIPSFSTSYIDKLFYSEVIQE